MISTGRSAHISKPCAVVNIGWLVRFQAGRGLLGWLTTRFIRNKKPREHTKLTGSWQNLDLEVTSSGSFVLSQSSQLT
jgi:hypothetical protein